MSLPLSELQELRDLAREMAEAQQKAADAGSAFEQALKRAMQAPKPLAITAEQLCDPEVAEAMGSAGKPNKAVSSAIGFHATALVVAVTVVSPEVAGRANDALGEGQAAAKRRCQCDACVADRARARDAAEASVARARAAAGGPGT